jgi:hypothetical protein
MTARKKIMFVNPPENESLRSSIAQYQGRASDKEAMKKDLHLVEAALSADKIVVSLDSTARDLFASVCERTKVLRTIVWPPPVEQADVVGWLERRTREPAEWRLG